MATDYKTKIGHAHLKVRDLQHSIDFYTRYLQLHVTEVVGNHYAFLTAGTYHHEIALQNVGPDAPHPSARGTGLVTTLDSALRIRRRMRILSEHRESKDPATSPVISRECPRKRPFSASCPCFYAILVRNPG